MKSTDLGHSFPSRHYLLQVQTVTDLSESPVPFIAAAFGWSDEVWLLFTETRLADPWEGAGLVLTMTVPPAGASLPTCFTLQQETQNDSRLRRGAVPNGAEVKMFRRQLLPPSSG